MAVHAESSIQLNTIPAYTSLLGGHFYYKSTEATQEHPTPPSANIIEIASTPSNPSTWKYNTHIGANGIKLRYNEIDLSVWSALNGLQLYSPTVTNGVIVDNQLGAQLTSSALTFYKPGAANLTKGLELDATTVKFYGSNQSNPDAILSSTGLKLVKGGIEAGTSGQTGFVYISSEDYQLKDATHNGIIINGHTPTAAGTDGKIVDDPAWREIIGTKFGVDSEGNLYASNADIGGKITATSGAIGGWQIGTDSNKSLYYGNSTPGYSTDTLVISKYSVTNTNSIANSATGLHWFLAAGTKFGVTIDGTLYANGANITNINGANITANTISIGTMNSEAQLAILNGKTYNIGVNNGTTGWHFLGTLTLTGQTDEAQIEIHTGSGQNNTANQNLTILVNIKRGYQASQSTTGGITVRYEGNPTIVNMGTNVCSIVVRCTTVGVMNVYLYTPTWGYADGWYQVKGRGCSWVHSGTLVTTEPNEGIAQSVTVMNPYTTATSYITDISNDGIKIHDANTTSNSIVIDSNGIDIYKNNTSVAFYGDYVRVGRAPTGDSSQDSSYLRLDPGEMKGIDKFGNPYFDIIHNGAESPYLITSVLSSNVTTAANIDVSSNTVWTQIANNEDFEVIIDYYMKNSSGTITEYYDTTEEIHTKGVTDPYTYTYSQYTTSSANRISILNAYPSLPTGYSAEGWTFSHKKVILGLIQQVKRPLYRFGEDVAATGGANSFLMGRGTIASGANTLAIGQYNKDNSDIVDGSSYFIVGGGINDEHRKNLFEVFNGDGTFPNVYINETPLQTWVETGEDWGNEGGGTDGYYRMWTNGIAEYWYTYVTTATHYNTWGTGYAYYVDITFPPGLFVAPPCPTFSGKVGTGFGIPAGVTQVSTTGARFFIISSASGSQSITLNIHVIGRWYESST